MVGLNLIKRFANFFERRYGVGDYATQRPALATWLSTHYGQLLLKEEKTYIDAALSDVFGYHLLELSISDHTELSDASRIRHRFSLSPDFAPSLLVGQCGAQAEIDDLPLASESVDVVILHHTLEFSQRPHLMLREVSRVLMPRGRVIIVGFNPSSLFGLFKAVGRFVSCRPQWRHQNLGKRRVLDWLRLLDFEALQQSQGFYRPPVSHPKVLRYLSWLELIGKKLHLPGGSFYFIVARKDVAAMTPLKPNWQTFRPMVGLGGREPASRMPEPVSRQKPNV